MRYIGKEMSRVDGVAKVTGKATALANVRSPWRAVPELEAAVFHPSKFVAW